MASIAYFIFYNTENKQIGKLINTSTNLVFFLQIIVQINTSYVMPINANGKYKLSDEFKKKVKR